LASGGQAPALEAARDLLERRGCFSPWLRARAVAERAATPVFTPRSARRRPQATPYPGLALAGDWTDTGLPATLEGAVCSGRLAFEALSFNDE
jgi:uncharacterized protein with NAD-binding domain and iron-sulfur cluster